MCAKIRSLNSRERFVFYLWAAFPAIMSIVAFQFLGMVNDHQLMPGIEDAIGLIKAGTVGITLLLFVLMLIHALDIRVFIGGVTVPPTVKKAMTADASRWRAWMPLLLMLFVALIPWVFDIQARDKVLLSSFMAVIGFFSSYSWHYKVLPPRESAQVEE